MKTFLGLAVALVAITGTVCDVWLPREVGRFSLSHAAFIEVFERTDENLEYLDRLDLVISTFNPATMYFHDAVYTLPAPGRKMDQVASWGGYLEQLGGASTAFWPNYPVQVPKEIAGFDGVVQTSGFLVPGKKSGKLEVYNQETGAGPWVLSASDEKDYSYHWVVWKDMDADGFKDVLTARFHVPLFGDPEAELVWFKNPGILGTDGQGWTEWEQFLLVAGGPDVYFEEVKLQAEGTTYSALIASELWTERITLYYVEDVPGAWTDPANIQSVVIDEKPGQPFEAKPRDVNADGTLEVLASAYDKEAEIGNLWMYEMPEDFRTPNWPRRALATNFTANSYLFGSSMVPGKQRLFYPSEEYSAQTNEDGSPVKPLIALSGDDDGIHYILYPKSEDKADWEYDMRVMVDSEQTTAGTMAIADLDGDGYVEIISAGYTAGIVYVYTFAPL